MMIHGISEDEGRNDGEDALPSRKGNTEGVAALGEGERRVEELQEM